MTYPTAEQFRDVVVHTPSEQLHKVVSDWLFDGTPYIFRSAPQRYEIMRESLAQGLAIDADCVTVVGSTRLGFSTVPEKYGTKIHDDSDVDVVIVSEGHFDQSWADLVRWRAERGWGYDHSLKSKVLGQNKRIIFWGSLRVDQLCGVTDVAMPWNDAFRSLARIPELARYPARGLLYRTWNHVRQYHVNALHKLLQTPT